jgi:putative oxidoreductase
MRSIATFGYKLVSVTKFSIATQLVLTELDHYLWGFGFLFYDVNGVIKRNFDMRISILSGVLFPESKVPTGGIVLVTRLVVGFGFLQHGYSKVVNGAGHFAASLHGLGIPGSEFMSLVTIFAELICGAFMLIGALVPLMCLPMTVILLVAMFFVHLPFGFSSIKLQAVTPEGIKFGPPGYEVILLYLVSLSALFRFGAGPFSVDSWLKKKFKLNKL